MQRILVVEDDFLIADFLEQELSSGGTQVVIATTGAEALEVAKDGYFDWVLLDLELPDLSGLEVLRTLRRVRRPPRIVIVSGHTQQEIQDNALHGGAEAFFAKPVNMEVLHAYIVAG